MKKLRISILVHEALIPPRNATVKKSEGALWKTEFDVARTLKSLGHSIQFIGLNENLDAFRRHLFEFKPDIVFNLLEEFKGEAVFDQHIVSYLELKGYPYTGCNPRGLTLARDKALSKKILSFHDISTPAFNIVPKERSPNLDTNISFPLFVKSLVEEASLGISQASVVKNPAQLKKRVKFIHKKIGTDALIEEYIEGREFYIGVIGNKRPITLPIYQLHFSRLRKNAPMIATRTVKWNQKYRNKYGIKATPAKLPKTLDLKLKAIAKKTYLKLGISGYARIDFRVNKNQQIYVLECNPNPGIAIFDEFPQAAKKAGVSYSKLLEKIIALGLRRYSEK